MVLVGGGHAHLHALRHAEAYARLGATLTLVSPGPLPYSGLLTSVLGGACPPALSLIDTHALARRHGARVIATRATALDLERRLVHLADHPPLPFDLAALALGARTAPLPGEDEHPARVFPVKPTDHLLALHAVVSARFRERAPTRVVVAGGGLAAFEVAANLLERAKRDAAPLALTILPGLTPLAAVPPRAARALLAHLTAQGAVIVPNERAVRVTATAVEGASGCFYPCDLVVSATGSRPQTLPRLPARSEAPDGLVTDTALRAAPTLFAAGDMAAFPDPLPKAGVFAIREGLVLHANLLARLSGRPLKPYRPQKTYLWVMALGPTSGLAVRGRFWWRGRAALWLKNRIDRRFVRRLRRDSGQAGELGA